MKKKIIEEKTDYIKFVLPIFLILMFGAGLFGVSTYLGYTKGFMTDGQCDNQTQLAFDYGVNSGIEYALIQLTNESLQCNQIPINYSNYSYSLIAVECLQGVQNG